MPMKGQKKFTEQVLLYRLVQQDGLPASISKLFLNLHSRFSPTPSLLMNSKSS